MSSYNEIDFVKNGIQGKIKTKFIKQVPPTIDDKQICLSFVISNSQLYISHMPTYHCSSNWSKGNQALELSTWMNDFYSV
jgi:hypothetical protein